MRTTSFLSSTAISLPTRVLKKEKNSCKMIVVVMMNQVASEQEDFKERFLALIL